jgi:hypothetical protein
MPPLTQRFADIYLRDDTQQRVHEAVVCLPIKVADDHPIAVLSLATIVDTTPFYSEVVAAERLFQTEPQRSEITTSSWIGKLRTQTARILRELRI